MTTILALDMSWFSLDGGYEFVAQVIEAADGFLPDKNPFSTMQRLLSDVDDYVMSIQAALPMIALKPTSATGLNTRRSSSIHF